MSSRVGPSMFVGVSLLGITLGANPVHANEPAHYAPAESAAVARSEWQKRRQARSEGDLKLALRHAERAHAAWPGQWVYAYGLASSAAAVGDEGTVTRGLRDLLRLGAAPDLGADSTLERFVHSDAGKRGDAPKLYDILAKGLKALPRSKPAFSFPDAESTFWAEGLARDPGSGDFLLADVRHGRIARIGRDNIARDFSRIDPKGGWSALAVAIDAQRGRVWATAAALPQAEGFTRADSGHGLVLAFDRATGDIISRHVLPAAPEGHVPGDVVVARSGDVYVSDSAHPVIYRIRDNKLEEFATDPGFRSLQGQALDEFERTLYVADYSHGLAAIDLATRSVRWLPPPAYGSILGIDGMAWVSGGIVAVQNGLVPPRVIRIDFVGSTPDSVAGVLTLDRNLDVADEPTLIVADGEGVTYVANSHWEKYDEVGMRRPGTSLRAPVGLHLPRVQRYPHLKMRLDPVDAPEEGKVQWKGF